MQKLLKNTKTRQQCDQNCPEEPQRYPRGPKEAHEGSKWPPRGPKGTQMEPQRVPKGSKRSPKGSKKEPKRVPQSGPKGGPIFRDLISWILTTVSIQMHTFGTCLSKEREARFLVGELRTLVRQRIPTDILWKTLSFTSSGLRPRLAARPWPRFRMI